MSVEVGQQAPNFSLLNTERQPVTLESLRGKPVILAFFPLAFSPVCTEEMCTFRDTWAELNGANAQVVGISVDSPFALRAFAEAQKLQYPLLSDFNKETSAAFGVLNENLSGVFKGVANRAIFVIDANGKIAYRWVSEDARVQPNYDEVKAKATKAL
jgi:glutaredoxin-dependent peroxiredoxin